MWAGHTASKDAPLVCRGCFATNTKLHNICENNLAETYIQLIGISLQDNFSQHLCAVCKALLLKFSKFKESCRKVQELFDSANRKDLSPATLLELSQHHYKPKYTQAPPASLHTEYVDAEVEIKVEDEEFTEPTADETTTEPQDTIVFIKNDVEEEFDTKDTADSEEVDNGETVVVLEPVKTKVKREKVKKKNAKRQVTVKKEFGRKKKSPDDIMKIADMQNFDVVFLTKEEQLQEVADRKSMKIRCSRVGYTKCELCGKNVKGETQGEDQINEHYKSCHDPSIGNFVCDICYFRFKDRRRLNPHLRTHREKFMCRTCDFVAKGEASARKHYEWHKGTKFDCQYCGQTFPKLTTCLSHTRLKHASELPWCEICGESFIGEKGVQTHKKLAHKNIEAPNFVCVDCDVHFLNEKALDTHIGLKKCDLSNCVQCGEGFSSPQLLKYHLVQGHGGAPLTADCADCAVRFHSEAALLRHTFACGSSPACAQCGEHFASAELLAEHAARQHPASETFRCGECERVFESVFYFREHYARGHRKCRLPTGRKKRSPAEKPPPVRRWTVAEDRRVLERGAARARPERGAVCEVCGKGFSSVALLKYHQRLHSGEGLLACPHCPKKFHVPLLLQNHTRVHTGERPFQCAFCPKAFKTAVNFKRHHLVHSGLRAHVCELCQKAFQTSSCVKSHIRTVHMKIPAPPRARRPKLKND